MRDELQPVQLEELLNKNRNKTDVYAQSVNKISEKYKLIDLNKEFIGSPKHSFLIRTTGDSMIGCGINTNDLLIVDRTVKPENGMIVVAEIDNKITVKKYYAIGKTVILKSANSNYSDIKLELTEKFRIWGVVTSVIKTL